MMHQETTVTQAKKMKSDLANTIKQLLEEFTHDTGLVVTGLEIERFESPNGNVAGYYIDIETKL